MKNPAEHCCMDWKDEPNQPRPDYLSSSRKRLAPQLIFKGGIFHSWKKKTAVALNTGFFNTLPPISEVSEHEADIAWLIYDVQLLSQQGVPGELRLRRTVYTKFDTALSQITEPQTGEMSAFLGVLQKKLDEKLSQPPVNKTVAKPFK